MQTEILYVGQPKLLTWIPCVVLKQQENKYWVEFIDPLSFLSLTIIVNEELIREFQ